jgi:hypothetical protein
MSSKLRDFLRRLGTKGWSYGEWLEDQIPNPPDPHYMSTEDWIDFSSKFVESVNGSKVNSETGLSRKEFLEYMKSGYLPNKEFFDDYWDE